MQFLVVFTVSGIFAPEVEGARLVLSRKPVPRLIGQFCCSAEIAICVRARAREHVHVVNELPVENYFSAFIHFHILLSCRHPTFPIDSLWEVGYVCVRVHLVRVRVHARGHVHVNSYCFVLGWVSWMDG